MAIMNGMDRVANLDALYDAFQKCKKGSNWKESVQKYEAHLWENLLQTRRELLSGVYRQRPFVEFTVWERGRKRLIKSIHIYDRVVQRSLCDNVLTPLIEPKLIYDNGASRDGMGPSFTRRRVASHLQSYYDRYGTNRGYVILTDYKGYFDSIVHDILIADYRQLIPWDDVCNLVEHFIRANPGKAGVGIGAQISQNAGIFYTTPIDQYFKTVCGVKCYDAFMDDRLMIVREQEEAQELLLEFRERSSARGLAISERKTHISRLEDGFTFLKTRFQLTPCGEIVIISDKGTFVREQRRLKKFKKIRMNPRHALYCYRSWRGTVEKQPENRERVQRMDELFCSLFPEMEI